MSTVLKWMFFSIYWRKERYKCTFLVKNSTCTVEAWKALQPEGRWVTGYKVPGIEAIKRIMWLEATTSYVDQSLRIRYCLPGSVLTVCYTPHFVRGYCTLASSLVEPSRLNDVQPYRSKKFGRLNKKPHIRSNNYPPLTKIWRGLVRHSSFRVVGYFLFIRQLYHLTRIARAV